MSRRSLVLGPWLPVLLLAVTLSAQDQQTSSTISAERILTEEEADDAEARAEAADQMGIAVGLEAYHEVLLSGRYRVGPGDKFLVFITDMLEPAEVTVLAEGGLFIPRVGRVEVGGLRLKEARAAIDSAFSSTVRVGRIDVELSHPRQFPVSVVGLVRRPGVVMASAVERVSEVLQRVGGLNEYASLRSIVLLSSDSLTLEQSALLRQDNLDMEMMLQTKGVRRVDLAMYGVTGGSAYNPFIEDGDILVVPSRQYVLRAMESVRRPDTYEFVPGDRLSTLATLAMGPSARYDPDNVILFRYVDDGARQIYLPVDLDAAIAGDLKADILLEPGDWLVPRARPEFQREATVQLIGEVMRPGFYVVGLDGKPLRQVVEESGGFTDEAALPQARVVRQTDDEVQTDPEFERIVTIPPAEWDEDEKQYFNMRSRQKQGQMVVDFVALFIEHDEEQNILLRPGDVVVIPGSQRTVLVSGQAANPGAVPYVEGYGVSDYIERAGGFGWRSSKDVRVIRARTGEVRKAKQVQHLEPGDNIWIKEQPVRDYWAVFMEGMQVAGQVATVLLVFITILK
jgi:polysaccharide biosynthesis/export protein